MYQQFLDQAGTLFKPLQDLVSLNQTALEALTNKQSALVSEIINDSISFTQKVLAEKDGNYWDLHKAYWEGVNQKLNQASQDAADYFSATHTKLSDMMQESLLGSAMAEVTKNMPSVEAAIASALKPMDTAKIKPAAEASKVPAAKPSPAPAIPKAKPAAAKTVVEKPAAKPAAKAAAPKAAEAKPAVSKPVESKSAKVAEKPVVAKPSVTKPSVSEEKSTRVAGDDATVESVIRSIMAERNH
ncbi:MAG: phasin family protein [Marinagarivorans sp.]